MIEQKIAILIKIGNHWLVCFPLSFSNSTSAFFIHLGNILPAIVWKKLLTSAVWGRKKQVRLLPSTDDIFVLYSSKYTYIVIM